MNNYEFLLSILAGIVASITVLAGQVFVPVIRNWIHRRHLLWVWDGGGEGKEHLRKPVGITFSLVELSKIEARKAMAYGSHVGDAQAAAIVSRTLAVEMKSDSEFLHGSSDSLFQNRRLVCIGGPKFNTITKYVLECVYDILPLRFESTTSGDYFLREVGSSHDGYRQSIIQERTVEDWGVIIKIPHPEKVSSANGGCNVIVLAGLSTFGTLAAAKFLTDNKSVRQLRKRTGKAKSKYFVALVRCRSSYDYIDVNEIDLVKTWSIDPR